MIERVPLLQRLTHMEAMVMMFLARGYDYHEAAERLHVSRGTIKSHAVQVARAIPGDLPAQMRIVVWARGASLDVLEGTRLKALPPGEAFQGITVVSSTATSTR